MIFDEKAFCKFCQTNGRTKQRIRWIKIAIASKSPTIQSEDTNHIAYTLAQYATHTIASAIGMYRRSIGMFSTNVPDYIVVKFTKALRNSLGI